MFTDMVGYTALMQKNEALAREKRARHREVFKQLHESFEGQIIQYFGDGTLSIFPSSVNAVACAIDMQALLKEPIEVPLRIGLHIGEVVLEEDGILGDAVNLASRVESFSVPGGVLISDTLFDAVKNQEQFQFRPMGTFQLKNVERPFELYALANEGLIVPDPVELQGKGQLQSSRQNNLPKLLSSFIGRENELKELRLLIRQHRLITLTGPGGTGKTRLSIQLAREVAFLYPDGVFWIPLAAVHDSEIVAFAIANELGLKEDSLLSIEEVLIQYFQDKRILLVLDNFEQILDAAGLIEELLLSCETLKVLVSSRIILQIAGEEEYQVSPLPLPELTSSNALEGLQRVPSVALFAERARSNRSNFALTKDNVEAVAHICQRLDGLPLAIELAAARTKLFNPNKLLSRLTNRLDVLKGGRQFVERHQTLRQTIAWSYDLLEVEEQELFRRSSVFVGGSTVEAIGEVCGQNGLSDWDIEEGVQALVDKSLIKTEEYEDELRFYMLETIREYAVEALGETEKAVTMKQAHIQYYLHLAEEGVSALSGSRRNYWAGILLAEQANFRAAIDYAIELGEMSYAYRLGVVLRPFWANRGMAMEGVQQLEKIISVEVPESHYEERLGILQMLGVLYLIFPIVEKAIPMLEECLAYWRTKPNPRALGMALNDLGWGYQLNGRYKKSIACSLEAKEIFETLPDEARLVASLNNLGLTHLNRLRLKEATSCFERNLQLTQRLNDSRRNAFTLINLGFVNYEKGNFERAESLVKEAINATQKISAKFIEGHGYQILGRIYYAMADFDACALVSEQILSFSKDIQAHFATGAAYYQKAIVAFGRKEFPKAMEWMDQALGIYQRMDAAYWTNFVYDTKAKICLALGKIEVAKACGKELLENEIEENSFGGLIPGLEIAARVAFIDGRLEEATCLYFHAHALREEIGAPILPSESYIYAQFERDLQNEINAKNLHSLQTQKYSLQESVQLAENIFRSSQSE